MTHGHKMPPLPFVHRKIFKLKSMPPPASPFQQTPPTHNRTHAILFYKDNLPRALYHIIQILWRFALIAFYRVDIELEPFKPNDIWSNTIRRFTELTAAKCAHLLSDRRRNEARATPPPDDFLEK